MRRFRRRLWLARRMPVLPLLFALPAALAVMLAVDPEYLRPFRRWPGQVAASAVFVLYVVMLWQGLSWTRRRRRHQGANLALTLRRAQAERLQNGKVDPPDSDTALARLAGSLISDGKPEQS